MTARSSVTRLIPGLVLVLSVAIAARGLHALLPGAAGAVIGEVVIAVLLGLLIANTVSLPAATAPGISFCFKTLLRLAIVILGARFSFLQIVAIGGKALGIIVVLMILALVVAHSLGRAVKIPGKLATLIGVGTAVCGNTAISAVAPVIGARDDDVSYAIATNTLFGTLAVFVYPLVGHALGMSDAFFGSWAGTAVNDTSQVVATGFAYSDLAGEIATTVKLTRNALMAFVIVGAGLAYGQGSGGEGDTRFVTRLRQSIPGFVLGFLLMALLNTLGVFDAISERIGRDLVADFKLVASFLILMALAGVGLGTRLTTMRRIGLAPFLVGLATALTTAAASYALLRWLGPAGG